jgi:hypothetical protein
MRCNALQCRRVGVHAQRPPAYSFLCRLACLAPAGLTPLRRGIQRRTTTRSTCSTPHTTRPASRLPARRSCARKSSTQRQGKQRWRRAFSRPPSRGRTGWCRSTSRMTKSGPSSAVGRAPHSPSTRATAPVSRAQTKQSVGTPNPVFTRARALSLTVCRPVRLAGGAPTHTGTNGTCTTGTGVNGSGLWIFTRKQKRDPIILEKIRAVAQMKGFDLSVLIDIDQTDCNPGAPPHTAAPAHA